MRMISFYSFTLIVQKKGRMTKYSLIWGGGARSRTTFIFSFQLVVVSSYKNKILTVKCTKTNIIKTN